MRSIGAFGRWAALAVALASGNSCGGADSPTGPGDRPSPTPSAPQGTGAVAGRYLLQLTPASGCGMSGTASFPMTAVSAVTARYPGVQAVLSGSDVLEVEFRASGDTLVGGLGTTEQGALANEAIRVWMRTIGTGTVQRAADGRGQIAAGVMAGHLAFGHPLGTEGSLGSCTSTAHTFSLRTQ